MLHNRQLSESFSAHGRHFTLQNPVDTVSNIVQILRVLFRPALQKPHKRGTVITDNHSRILSTVILIQSALHSGLFKESIKSLSYNLLHLIPIIGSHALTHKGLRVQQHQEQISELFFRPFLFHTFLKQSFRSSL